MKTILLTKNQLALVDDLQYEELNQWKWHALWNEHTQSFYAVRYVTKGTIYMHRQIMNTSKKLQCDHVNHNTLDNQEKNLRNVTRSQNQMNRGVQAHNKLQQKCIQKRGKNSFRVEVWKNGYRVFAKTFQGIDNAVVARDAAIKQFHGDYAYEEQS